ncbi:MAG: NADH-quinone oxidoreductase subunit B [Candidatus Ranarchaeia archaeon]
METVDDKNSVSRKQKKDLVTQPEDELVQDTKSFAGNAFVGKLSDFVKKVANVNPIRYILNWARMYSLWPTHITTSCCCTEFGAASGPRFDMERFGLIQAVGGARQSDLLVIEGTISYKMLPRLERVWEQMPAPKYSIAMGACALSGGLYYDSYNVVPGIDKYLPVDVYLPGCPPRPEALIQSVLLLREKIGRSRIE